MLKKMNVKQAIGWINAYRDAYDDSPATWGQSKAWIVRAGQLCRNNLIDVEKADRVPVTDELLRESLQLDPLPPGTVI